MSEFTKADAAKFLYRLICKNVDKARGESYSANAQVSAADRANQDAQDDPAYRTLGGYRKPYEGETLNELRRQAKVASDGFQDWQKVREWYLEDIFDKYIVDEKNAAIGK